MVRRNLELAQALDRLSLYLELDGADKFRCRAYQRAARSVGAAPYDVVERVLDVGDPGPLPGVGPRIGALIREYAAAGRLSRLEQPIGSTWTTWRAAAPRTPASSSPSRATPTASTSSTTSAGASTRRGAAGWSRATSSTAAPFPTC